MIGSTILGTGINSMLGVDSRYGTDSGLGIDSIFERIPCDSNSGSCGPDQIPIPIQEKKLNDHHIWVIIIKSQVWNLCYENNTVDIVTKHFFLKPGIEPLLLER